MKVADEYGNFHVNVSEFGVTAYRVKVDSGIAVIQECVHVTNDLHVILSFESSPIPLLDYISTAAGCKLTSLDMLTNLPNYCRNASQLPYRSNRRVDKVTFLSSPWVSLSFSRFKIFFTVPVYF